MEEPLARWNQPPWGWRGGEAAAVSRIEPVLQRLARIGSGRPEETGRGGSAEWPTGRLACRLHPPASADSIADTELRLGMALPADYACFLMFADGASLTDSGDAGRPTLALLGTEALIRCADETDWLGRAEGAPETLIFAAIGSEEDHLAFETGRVNPCRGCAVLDARHAYRPDRWWVIARDFTEWLDRLLTDPGPPGAFGRHWEPALSQPALPLTGLTDPDGEPSDPSR